MKPTLFPVAAVLRVAPLGAGIAHAKAPWAAPGQHLGRDPDDGRCAHRAPEQDSNRMT